MKLLHYKYFLFLTNKESLKQEITACLQYYNICNNLFSPFFEIIIASNRFFYLSYSWIWSLDNPWEQLNCFLFPPKLFSLEDWICNNQNFSIKRELVFIYKFPAVIQSTSRMSESWFVCLAWGNECGERACMLP